MNMENNFIKELEKTENNEIGTKLKNLKIISERTNYLIPKTIVLTKDFYKFLINYNDILNPLSFKWKSLKIPAMIRNKIISEIKKVLGNEPLVIRSSTSCEDLPHSSFSGIFSSFLDIKDKKNLFKAIRSCYASFFSKRAKAYAQYYDIKLESETISIGIQRLIRAKTSGVLFTTDPVFVNKNRSILEYTNGLSAKMVSGYKAPNYIEISRIIKKNSDPLIFQLLKMGNLVERIFDQPQDIEWGIINNRLFVFQSRPITTLNNKPIKINKKPSRLKQIGYGKPAAIGQCMGNLLILKNKNDYRRIKKGDILFAKHGINIDYILPVISKINGIITTGGILSHTATVIREFQKPCLVEPFYLEEKYENKDIFIDATNGRIFSL